MHKIVCVTGASGLIGSHILRQLQQAGLYVRALSRTEQPNQNGVEWFVGSLADTQLLHRFLSGAELVFHCAAELCDELKMKEVNVEGTRTLVTVASEFAIPVFCHISTVDVVGMNCRRLIDETTPADPYSEYDRTKWEAEQIVAQSSGIRCRVIVRPGNVFDAGHLKSLQWIKQAGWESRLKLIVQGRERPHLIYAGDVAAAAIYLSARESAGSETFIVSSDDDPFSTYAGIRALIAHERAMEQKKMVWALPPLIPFVFRFLIKRRAIRGDAVYSSNKLLKVGFEFPSGLYQAIRHVLGLPR